MGGGEALQNLNKVQQSASPPSYEIEERMKQGDPTGAGESFSTSSSVGKLLSLCNWKIQDRNHRIMAQSQWPLSHPLSSVSVFLFIPPLIKIQISFEAHHLRENEKEEVEEEEDKDKERLYAKIISRFMKDLSIKLWR